MATTTVSAKSQIVLPAEIRRALGIRTGDQLEVSIEDDHIVLRRAPQSDTAALAAFGGEIWAGYAEELQEQRDTWD